MPSAIQWLLCAVLGVGAAIFLLRHFHIWPRPRAADDGACGGCAHCDVPKKPMPS